jgi:hypothetical protein
LNIHLPHWRVARRNVEKEDKARFNNAWFVAAIKVVGEQFHNNFRARFRAHPLGYRGFGLGMTSQQQRISKEQRRRKMQLVGHVLAKLQTSIQQ